MPSDILHTVTRRRLAGYALGAFLTAPLLTGAVSALLRWSGWTLGLAGEALYLAAFAAVWAALFAARLALDPERSAELFLMSDIVLDDSRSTLAKLGAVLTAWCGFGAVYLALVLATLAYGAVLALAG